MAADPSIRDAVGDAFYADRITGSFGWLDLILRQAGAWGCFLKDGGKMPITSQYLPAALTT